MRSVEDHLTLVTAAAVAPRPVRVAISEAQGLMCAEEVVTEHPMPGFDQAAIDGYASLNRQALGLLRPGGLLATASCAARVGHDDFLGAVKEAAFKAGVDLALVEERYQPPDHPIRLQFPEGRYLKFYVMASV